MTEADWANADLSSLGFLLRGEAGEYHLTATGEPQPDESFLLLLNASHLPLGWRLPHLEIAGGWTRVIDTAEANGFGESSRHGDGEEIPVAARSLVLMIRTPPSEEGGEER
jgi:glycogen operon protein